MTVKQTKYFQETSYDKPACLKELDGDGSDEETEQVQSFVLFVVHRQIFGFDILCWHFLLAFVEFFFFFAG